MSASISQTKTYGATALETAPVVTWTNDTKTGSFVIVALACLSGAVITSITDSQSNKYLKAFSQTDGVRACELWYCQSILGGVTPTITVNQASSKSSIIIREYDTERNLFLNKSAGQNNGATTSHSSTATALVTTGANQLVVGVIALADQGANLTATGSYANLSQITTTAPNATQLGIEDFKTTTPNTQNASFATVSSVVSNCGVAVFSYTPFVINNYQQFKVPDGMSTSEKLR